MASTPHYDVVIIGAGLAGLSLAQQLIRTCDKRILLVDRRADFPPKRQKMGESLVQVGGYYFAKVLDLEEYLLREHYMKYNLRFYWKSAHRENRNFEDYGQAYIRTVSNIPTYQLNRNKIEGELLRRNLTASTFEFQAPVTDLDVMLSETGPHTIRFNTAGQRVEVSSEWVVDTSGRGKVLERQLDLKNPGIIRHGTSICWVEGLVDIEKLTDLSPAEIRLKRNRAAIGHLPLFLATNHFMGEGLWFWVIPLQGITSLGLVHDRRVVDGERVSSPQKLIEWACEEFPLFARDLPYRTVTDRAFIKDFSYNCEQTIHKSKWALSGEAGRFTDPLYSPGSDFIAIHNTLIIDAILTTDPEELAGKCSLYELMMRSFYEALVPTYGISYDALGDQEAFVLKYTWELSTYFVFFVVPMINDLLTDRQFIISFLSKFSRLGRVNKNLQAFISAYFQWKKTHRSLLYPEPLFHDFTRIGTLRHSESAFYRVGLSADEASRLLDEHLASLIELAHYIVTYVHSVVLSEPDLLTNRSFIQRIDLQHLQFDPDEMRRQRLECHDGTEPYLWSFDPFVLEQFRLAPHKMEVNDE